MRRYLRYLIIFLIIIICFLLQTTFFQTFALAGVSPNLLIIIVVSIAYMGGKNQGIIIGLICGLLYDFIYSDVIGLYSLIYMFIGYINGFLNKIYYSDDFTMPIFIIGISDFIYGISVYIFEFLLRGKLNILFYIRRIILPETVYTLLISVILYKILHSINSKIETKEGEV